MVLSALIVGLVLGKWFFGGDTHRDKPTNDVAPVSTIWTCTMHPQIRQTEPGQCPICGMDLVPLRSTETGDPGAIHMSATAMQLANVQTQRVSKGKAIKQIRLNGKVQVDERTITSQSSHIPGRIERLMINYTGEDVRKGQQLATVYSPELVVAQEELFEAHRLKSQQPELYQAARSKLSKWKLSDAQIDGILAAGTPKDNFSILSEASGVVMRKWVNTGDYIQKGQVLYDVADLSTVWVLFDVYERDLAWVHVGDNLEFTVSTLPGKSFLGQISFIDPIIDPATRVASARVEMKNSGIHLKPEMFAVGRLKSRLSQPENDLVIPASAVMWTGERSVVYVKQESNHAIGFQLREVVLGASLGDSYVVQKGLTEGEEIAVNGTFSIDAAAQLAGKPSMMNPTGAEMQAGHPGLDVAQQETMPADELSPHAAKALLILFNDYIRLKDELVQNNLEEVKKSTRLFQKHLEGTDMSLFQGRRHKAWMEQYTKLTKDLSDMVLAENLGEARRSFQSLSVATITLSSQMGSLNKTFYVQHCPMADGNRGADWLSIDKTIRNPYFGENMLTCGSIIKTIK